MYLEAIEKEETKEFQNLIKPIIFTYAVMSKC